MKSLLSKLPIVCKRYTRIYLSWASTMSGTVSLFISGMLLSKVLSAWVDTAVKLDDHDVILGLVCVAVLAASLNYTYLTNQVAENAKAIGRTAHLKSEHVGDLSSKSFTGVSFQELKKYVEAAEKSVFILATSYANDVLQSSDHPSRRDFLNAIERKIAANPRDFRYTRIQQIPPTIENVRDYLKQVTSDHCKAVLQLGAVAPAVNVMRIDQVDMTGFMIVDDKTLVVQLNGLSRAGQCYTIAVLSMTDNAGDQVLAMSHFAELLKGHARQISMNDVSEVV